MLVMIVFTLIGGLTPRDSNAQQVISLYADSIPNSRPTPDEEYIDTTRNVLIIHKISRPTLTIFLPDKKNATGAGVIICPGGGYWIAAAGHEGIDVAKKFAEMGIAAFVLKYRIPNDQTMVNKEIGPLQDAQRAIQLVRQNAKKWNVGKGKLGIMGFSAGGHVASTAGTHFGKSYLKSAKNINLRPDFMVLIYPVITFDDSVGHRGSRDQLIGKTPSREKIIEYSNEKQITSKTPPTFLVHAKDDPVLVENSLWFGNELKKNGIRHELLLFEKGGHGYGMYNHTTTVQWMDVLQVWMRRMKFIK
ncbi:MAG: alpha/beta hydrolase [Chitinophagaceae bacterium]|nr:alpha/beta hydrolase [Chitinophagaceae bacterium]